MADAIPLPWERLSPPAPAPRVAQGHVDAVIVDATRPESDRFRVRACLEDFPPPAARVFAAFVLYGATLQGVVDGLREGWTRAGIKIESEARSKSLVAFDLDGGYAVALAVIQQLARGFPP
jgi:hypothetical protein